MATQYEPIVKDSTLNTTESTPRNLADVLAEGLDDLANAVKPDASDIDLAPISGMSATNVQSGISELKGTLTNTRTLSPVVITIQNKTGTSDCVIDTQNCYEKNNILYLAVDLHSVSNTADIQIVLPSGKKFKQTGAIGSCGKGARWSVTGINYVYVGESTLEINTITANTYYHVIMALPLR